MTKSNNEKGNQYHSSIDGKFVSPNDAGEKKYNEEFDKQAVSSNIKAERLNEAIKNKIHYENLSQKQQRSLADHLIYTPIFEKRYGAQITEALGENIVKAMLPVKSREDDMAGNDFFIFDRNGNRFGIDLKTFSTTRGTIKIGLLMTDPPGSNNITKDYFLNPKKTNKFLAFQSIDFVNDERNNEMFYNETLQGKDVTERAKSGCLYLSDKNTLSLYFSENGLNENEMNELCSNDKNGLQAKLNDCINLVRNHPEINFVLLSKKIKETLGLNYEKNKFSHKLSKNFGPFSVVCEKNRMNRDTSVYIEINEGDFNDIDSVQYFDWRK